MLKQYTVPVIGIAMLFSLISCSKEETPENNNPGIPSTPAGYTVSGTASGSQQYPTPVSTSGGGSISGTYNPETNKLVYTIRWNSLSSTPTRMDFHGPALAGQQAGAAIGITGFPVNVGASHSGTATLSNSQEIDLLSGKWYYNIRTSNYPNGEIRGQIAVE